MRPYGFAMLLVRFLTPILTVMANVDGEHEERRRHYSGAVFVCVADVRRQNPYSQFDAHTTKAGELRAWGTEYDFYLFNKCMERHGYDTRVRRRGSSERVWSAASPPGRLIKK